MNLCFHVRGDPQAGFSHRAEPLPPAAEKPEAMCPCFRKTASPVLPQSERFAVTSHCPETASTVNPWSRGRQLLLASCLASD